MLKLRALNSGMSHPVVNGMTEAVLLCCLLVTNANARAIQEAGPDEARSSNVEKKARVSKLSIPDEKVFDQDGRAVRFYSDLIKDKVVVISFIFTTCAYICPMQGEALSKLMTALGARFGKDVHFICVTADPEADTAKRLKDWGAQFGARDGWTLVTGEKSQIDKVIAAFMGGKSGKGDHSPVIFIGNGKGGGWIRAYGLAQPEQMIKLINEVAAEGL